MWLEMVIFTLAMFGLLQLMRDGGVWPVLPSTFAVSVAVSALVFLVSIGFLQAHYTDPGPRRVIHLKFHPRDLTISMLQVGVHVLTATFLSCIVLLVVTWSASTEMNKHHFVFLFAGRVQAQTSLTALRVGIVVFAAVAATALVIVWVFFVIARQALSDLSGARAHLVGFAQTLVFILFFTQHALNDALQRACGTLPDSCALGDMPPLSRSDSLLREVMVSLASFLVLDVLAERGVDEYRYSRNWVWLLVYLSTRVAMLAAVGLFLFIFLDTQPEYESFNWAALVVLCVCVLVEFCGAIFSKFDKSARHTPPHMNGLLQNAPVSYISLGTRQPTRQSKAFIINSRTRRKLE